MVYLYVGGIVSLLPVFSAWVEKATRREKEFFLILWIASTFLPYFSEYISKYSFGTCEWNSFGLFYYFAGFSGYMLLGHYIQHYVRWSFLQTLLVSIPLLIIGFLITFWGYSEIMALPEKTGEQIELFWTYCTPNVLMMTMASFLLVTRVKISSDSLLAKVLSNFTLCGFGIYMIHYYFVYLGYLLGQWLHVPAFMRIPFSAVVILICSWTIVALVKRFTGKWNKYILG